MTAIFGRTTLKYGERGYCFAVLEIGHVAQNILLTACALGLAALPVGGFVDDDVHRVLDLDGVYEASFYLLLPIGHRPAATPMPPADQWWSDADDADDAVTAVTRMLWSGPAPGKGKQVPTPGRRRVDVGR